MSLPSKVIDRLFERLAATYGSEWTARWAGQDQERVKIVWATELGHFADCLDAIAFALENLPPRAPNAIEFKNLCRTSPRTGRDPALLKIEEDARKASLPPPELRMRMQALIGHLKVKP